MNRERERGRVKNTDAAAIRRPIRVGLLLTCAGLLAACSDSDPRPRGPQEFQATLTELHAVKKGSDETLPLEDLPVEGATLTLER